MRLTPQVIHPPRWTTVLVTMLARSEAFLDFPLNEQVTAH